MTDATIRAALRAAGEEVFQALDLLGYEAPIEEGCERVAATVVLAFLDVSQKAHAARWGKPSPHIAWLASSLARAAEGEG